MTNTFGPVGKMRAVVGRVHAHGLGDVARDIYRRRVVIPLLTARHRPMKRSSDLLPLIVDKRGLEIGGPSHIFTDGSVLPFYSQLGTLDNCNFADETVWEGRIAEGDFVLGGKVVGRQHICEAVDVAARLGGASGYDVVMSSNCLEHIANPLKAVEAWLTVLKPGGLLLLVLPNKRSNFDRLRPDTPFAHLLADYENDVGEDDETHFAELIEMTDMRLVPRRVLPDREALVRQTLGGAQSRCNHHHVFSLSTLVEVCAHFGLEVLLTGDIWTDFVAAARKPN